MQNIDQLFEQRWKERVNRYRKRQILFWAPVAATPVLVGLALIAGVGRNAANIVIAPAKPPMDFFSIAGKDSQKFMVHPSSHFPPAPSFPHAAALSVTREDPVHATPPQSNPAVDRANQSLRHFQELLKEGHSKTVNVHIPESGSLPAQPGFMPSQVPHAPQSLPDPESAKVPDPDLEHLDQLLSKVMAIQHPVQAQPRASDSLLSGLTDTARAVEAVTETEGVLTSGETMALRLESPLLVRGVMVPAGTRVYGTVSLENERLCIRVRSLVASGRLLAVSLNAFDMDGQLGIFVPGSLSRDVSKESAEEALGSLALTYDPSAGAQAANAGMQAMKTLLSRKVRAVRVVVRPGYRVYLK